MSKEAFKVLDTGKNRSAGDTLGILGAKSAIQMAAMVRSILLFKAGYYSTEGGERRKNINATTTAIVEFVNKNEEELTEIINYIAGISKNFRFIPRSSLCMLYYIFSKLHQSKCDTFFEKLMNGVDLGEQSGIRLLRERLLRDALNKTRLSGRDKIALTIMAWNAFRTGKKMQQLTLARNYKFPIPV